MSTSPIPPFVSGFHSPVDPEDVVHRDVPRSQRTAAQGQTPGRALIVSMAFFTMWGVITAVVRL